MHFGFNNKFIRDMRTKPIFEKFQKNILFSFSIWDYEFICTNLYVKRISYIKKVVFYLFIYIRTDRHLPDKIRIFLRIRTFLKP